ncbi:class I SAM-dependent methyltransferase [Alkaliphilus sp. B6464]|uniref:class I SAM-dependent methyltransferase n=1 Tax=Alkaliphilus sp. B6464 TaxID=2731219 RepID=UPI001BA6CE70|nr:class I SAM-dependent methyltransferase [Alkaliphilus sp. B6464]QUH19018.1 methyltransferase domain-containing protein [Alkaliphilus sp. B6464]
MQNETITKQFKENIKQLIEKGEIKSAKILLKKYRKMEPNDVDAYSMAGIIAMIEGRMVDAEEIFLQGYKLNNSHFDLLYNLGYLYEVKSYIRKALQYYIKARDNAETKEEKIGIEEVIERLGLTQKGNMEFEATRDNKERISLNNNKNENISGESITKYFNNTIDKEIIRCFQNKDFDRIVQEIQRKISHREYHEIIAICNYWLNKINKNTAIIYYFMAVAANGIKDFTNALKYHKKALELDNSLADLRNRKSKYKYNYEERNIACIGCGNEKFEVVNVCNQSISEDNKELINPIRKWVKCTNCNLIYANPLPAEEKLNKYYSEIAKEKFGGIYGDIDARFEFLVNMSNKRLEKIEGYTSGAKTLLDIGTGIGVFTGTALDRGWKAEGLELTPEDCQYAKDKFELELKQENFYLFNEDRKYDVVTLFEVIEHLQTPLKDLKQINKLIKDNGILVVATPIQDTLYGKKMKENNVFWNVVTHLSYFTKDVMLNYLEEAGFEVLEISGSNEGMGRMEFYCRKI